MLEEIFTAAGISPKEAEIYHILLEKGELPAGKITKLTPYKRSLVYKSLENLAEKELVLKRDAPGKIASFCANHPVKIKEIIEKKAESFKKYQKTIDEILPELVSGYNLSLNRPGIKFFEGEESLKKTLEDTLTSQTEIYLFMNNDALGRESRFLEINAEYIKKRQRAGIVKKIIEAGKKPELTFGISDQKYDAVTQIRYMKEPVSAFKSSLQIYDGKISYQTLMRNFISVLISDPNIYALHKAWFEAMWKFLE